MDPTIVKDLFDYQEGVLIWKERPRSFFASKRACSVWNARFAGKAAGYAQIMHGGNRQRINIRIGGHQERHYESRLVWAWHHGLWPIGLIDHIDGDTGNNRIENLRDVAHADNSKNMRMHPGNKTGVTGVMFNGRKWRAEIMANGKSEHLGMFDTLERAAEARRAAESRLGFHANHGRTM